MEKVEKKEKVQLNERNHQDTAPSNKRKTSKVESCSSQEDESGESAGEKLSRADSDWRAEEKTGPAFSGRETRRTTSPRVAKGHSRSIMKLMKEYRLKIGDVLQLMDEEAVLLRDGWLEYKQKQLPSLESWASQVRPV